MIHSGRYLLDTNTVSYILSGRSPSARQAYLQQQSANQIMISAITQAEIFFGLENKTQATRLRAAIEDFLASVKILPWNSSTAKAYGTIRSQLSRTGKTLSLMDLLIASHAIEYEATLVSHDQAFLHAAPLLNVVNWVTDL